MMRLLLLWLLLVLLWLRPWGCVAVVVVVGAACAEFVDLSELIVRWEDVLVVALQVL